MPKLITFAKALKIAEGFTKKHLLLGNGFSRACRNDIFAYSNLFKEANFDKLSPMAEKAFKILGTTDFEVVMRALQNASALVKLYSSSDKKTSAKLKKDAVGLRDVLVGAIAGKHPDKPSDIEDIKYKACRIFLSNFRDSIYTLNYDLLLYWALMHDEDGLKIKSIDGFHQPEDGPEDWVEWDSNEHRQNIFYLHGALHIYEDGPDIKKYTWCNTQVRLINQIRTAMKENKYPLFVAEGKSDQKASKVTRSSFLGRGFRSFSNIGGALFIHGFSMSGNDSHVMKSIAKNNVEHLFVSMHGDPKSKTNFQIETAVKQIKASRTKANPRRPLKVTYYNADSAKVWGN